MGEKYVIFKKEDWKSDPDVEMESIEGFVLRPSDIFARPTLDAYVHHVLTVLELDRKISILTSSQREHLEKVCDDASTIAREWQRGPEARIPD